MGRVVQGSWSASIAFWWFDRYSLHSVRIRVSLDKSLSRPLIVSTMIDLAMLPRSILTCWEHESSKSWKGPIRPTQLQNVMIVYQCAPRSLLGVKCNRPGPLGRKSVVLANVVHSTPENSLAVNPVSPLPQWQPQRRYRQSCHHDSPPQGKISSLLSQKGRPVYCPG